MRVHETVCAALKRRQVEAAFALMSEDVARVIVELARLDVTIYSTRHESGAIGMADGYARSSGRLGVAIVGRGPGLTNGTNALITAARAGTGMVIVTGASPATSEKSERAHRNPKHLDQPALLDSLRVPHVLLDSPASAVAEFEAAVEYAQRGTTVVINIPEDVADAEAGDDPARTPSRLRCNDQTVNDALISETADLLQTEWAVRKPLIVAGRGAVHAGVIDELTSLGNCVGALMCTTLCAKSAFAGHPFDIGVMGTFASSTAVDLAMASDVVLAFGCALNPFTTYGGDILRDKTIVQFDRDPEAFGRFLPVDLPVQGDLSQTVGALLDELERRGHRSIGWRSPDTAAKLAARTSESPPANTSNPGALDPRWLMAELDQILPEERTVVVDGGNSLAFSIGELSVPDPRSFLFPLPEYFSMGCGQALALGAAVARPNRVTVLAIGDGGAMMTLGELDTAVRYDLPIVVIVMNDSAFGAEVQLLEHLRLPDDLARYQNPSFEALATAMGARGVTFSTVDDLPAVRDFIGNSDAPMVVDCKIATQRPDYQDLLDKIEF